MPDISLSGVRAHPLPLRARAVRRAAGEMVRNPCLPRPGPAARRGDRLGGHPVDHDGRGRHRHHRLALAARLPRGLGAQTGRPRRTHGAARRGRGHPRPRLLRLLLRRPLPPARQVRGKPPRLRRGHARPGPRRRPRPALHLLGTDHRLLLPADRPDQRPQAEPAQRPAGPHGHRVRRPHHARRPPVPGPRGGHLPPLGDPRRPAAPVGGTVHGDRADPRRRPVQVRDLALQPLAAQRHGRPHPGQRLPARRRHGQGRRLPRRPARPRLRRRPALAPAPARPRFGDDAAGRLAGPADERPEARPRLRHRQPARLPRRPHRRRTPRHRPRRHRHDLRARPVQGAALPGHRHRRPRHRHP